ncbi:Kiwa anti-phage protein KwaB-like domain-containing protein [Rhodopseudomonas sp. BR0G17]|jgi:hypothetical protein|uniref:Kiwa anti-phage protein KwaB-like domain-containing protein n=1 Tax=Rhodopseudomonas sp. BR0G17 TaxID=2269368 RepID=UPI0013DF440B|nr:Kiwa anti-phage protein KwaB-like domain-containing protein [Rhodopseudomonas sp. BR0G17]NEW97975.1 DUF4868 domain-containing protein [Rhodopseudomonas sp. BR0G17]
MANLFAICRVGDQLVTKHIILSRPVQQKVVAVFEEQSRVFLDGIEEEVAFGSDWKPDDDQILVMDAPVQANAVIDAIANPMGLAALSAGAFTEEKVVALAVPVEAAGGVRVLFQLFTLQQVLSRKALTLMLSGDTFNELTNTAFTLAGNLVAIIEGGKLKFKSFAVVRRIFPLNEYYEAATDQQIEEFCSHESLAVADVELFKRLADQTVRKLVHALSKTNVLSQYQVDDIVAKAGSIGLQLEVVDGKIRVPGDKKATKQLLRFLDDSIYEAPLSALRYESNSKRRLG